MAGHEAVLLSLAAAALATVVLVLALWAAAVVRRLVLLRVHAWAHRAAPHLEVRGTALLRADQIARSVRTLVNLVVAAGVALALYLYAEFVLTRFEATRAWGDALGRYLVDTLLQLGGAALRTVPQLFAVVVIFAVTRLLTSIVRTLFDAVSQGRFTIPGVHPDTAIATRRIVNGLLWLFAIIAAYPYLPGSDSAAFKGVSVFTGLLLTLGSAGLVGQAMSGLVLMYARSFRVGQFVQVGDLQGTVVELGLLATRLRTTKNEMVTVPNSVMVNGPVTNYSAPAEFGHPLLIYSSVTIGYDVPWRRVHELLLVAAGRTEGALAEPAPFVLQRALDDSYVEYQVNVAVDPARSAEMPMLYAWLHAAIQDAFAAGGVEIMSPTYRAVRDGNRSTIPPLG